MWRESGGGGDEEERGREGIEWKGGGACMGVSGCEPGAGEGAGEGRSEGQYQLGRKEDIFLWAGVGEGGDIERRAEGPTWPGANRGWKARMKRTRRNGEEIKGGGRGGGVGRHVLSC